MTDKEHAEWLAQRKNSIGASDTPSLVGMGFGTPLRVYESKVLDQHWSGNDRTRIGLALEPYIAKRYEETMEVELGGINYQIYKHADVPAHATPDCKRPDGTFVQLKSVDYFNDDWGPNGTDFIPQGYKVQVIQEMACTGTEMIDVAAVARSSGEFRVYRVLFDGELWRLMAGVIDEFWKSFIETKTPPPATWGERQAKEIQKITVGKSIDLGIQVAQWCHERDQLKAIGKKADERADALKVKIREAMGDAEKAVADGRFRIRRSMVKPTHVEYDREGYEMITISPIKAIKS